MERNKKFRNHFSIVIEKLWKYALIIGLLLWNGISEMSEEETNFIMDHLIYLLIVVGVLGAITIYEILVWRKTWIMMDEHAVVITSGRIHHKKKTISLANVANVNIQRNLLETLFGTCKVKLDVNSSENNDSEMEIILKVDQASEFRTAIMSYVDQGKVENVNIEAQEHLHESEACSKKEIFSHCMYTITIGWFIAFVFLLIPLFDAFQNEGNQEMQTGLWGVLTLLLPVFGVIFKGIAGFLQYYKFTVYRMGDRIHISYGFFTRKMYYIPVHRINSLVIVSPALGRMFGRAYAKIVCVGVGDEEKELSLLTLTMKRKDLWNRLHELIPEFLPEQDFNTAMKKQASKARLLYVIRYLTGAVFAIAVPAIMMEAFDMPKQYMGWLVLLELMVQILWLVCVLFRYHTARWWMGEKQMAFSNGCMTRNTTLIPYRAVESFEFHQGPLVRKQGLFRATFDVKASNIVNSTINSCYMEQGKKAVIMQNIIRKL